MSDLLKPQDLRWIRASDGALAGVCKGLAPVLGIEIWILRCIWLIAALWFGTGVFLYLLLAISLPRVDRLDQALDRKLLGVCARISKKTRTEEGLLRLGALFLFLITGGTAILFYGLAYFIVPAAEEPVSRQTAQEN
jgi:phage shock protein C